MNKIVSSGQLVKDPEILQGSSCKTALHIDDIDRLMNVRVGDKILIGKLNDNGCCCGELIGTVIETYPRFLLLDFGKYRETRLRVDIYYNWRGEYKCLR